MDMGKKKPGLGALVLSIGKGKDDGDGADEESSEDYSEAAGEVFDALKADDKEAFAEAFMAAVMSCMKMKH
jgi:hypothetical protein